MVVVVVVVVVSVVSVVLVVSVVGLLWLLLLYGLSALDADTFSSDAGGGGRGGGCGGIGGSAADRVYDTHLWPCAPTCVRELKRTSASPFGWIVQPEHPYACSLRRQVPGVGSGVYHPTPSRGKRLRGSPASPPTPSEEGEAQSFPSPRHWMPWIRNAGVNLGSVAVAFGRRLSEECSHIFELKLGTLVLRSHIQQWKMRSHAHHLRLRSLGFAFSLPEQSSPS